MNITSSWAPKCPQKGSHTFSQELQKYISSSLAIEAYDITINKQPALKKIPHNNFPTAYSLSSKKS